MKLSPNFNINETNQNGETILMIAAKSGNISVVEYILSQENVKINAKTNMLENALHFACNCSKQGINGEIVKSLINVNCDIYQATKNNVLPLHFACKNCHPVAVKLLLDVDSDIINQKNGKVL